VCIGTQKHALYGADRVELVKETKRRGIAKARWQGGNMAPHKTWSLVISCLGSRVERQGYVNGGGMRAIKQNRLGILL
jgi:hypothetical protein